MMQFKTLSQALQLLIVVTSIIVQYYWFIENKSPIQLYEQIKLKIFNDFPHSNATPMQSTHTETQKNDNVSPPKQQTKQKINDEIQKPVIESNSIDSNTNSDQLLSDLISYEFETALEYFKYNEYPTKSTMYIQFWTLLFESLSNNYYYQSTRNKHPKEVSLDTNSFRHKVWQKEPVLLKTRDIFQQYAPSNNMETLFVSKILSLDTVINTLDKNAIYESPYTMFFHEKLHSINMDLNEYKRQNKLLSADYVSFKLSVDTLVINNAALIFKNVALLEQLIMNTFLIPVNTNAYISGMRAGNDQYSSTIHSDRQDIFILQTQGKKRWQVWEPDIKNPRFEQIRGKDDNVVTEEEISSLKLIYDVVLEAGDVLYIPRGYLHQVTLYEDTDDPDDLYMTANNDYSIHLSIGLEVDTLGFTMESFMFCAMGISLQGDMFDINQNKMDRKRNENELNKKIKDYSSLTWLSGYLWQWSFMEEETRKIFPFFETEYLLRNIDDNDDNLKVLQEFQKKLYDKTLDLIERFDVALENTKGIDIDKLKENKIPKVSINDIKRAHSIFHEGLTKLRSLFLAKLSLQRDKQFNDVLDRNSKFDELMVNEISNVYKKCGVPFDIVGDGDTQFGVDKK